MDEIGMRMVQDKKQAVLSELGSGRIEKKAVGGKDLLSLLIQANMAADVEPSHRLSDEEVIAQIPSFLVAGEKLFSIILLFANLLRQGMRLLRMCRRAVTHIGSVWLIL